MNLTRKNTLLMLVAGYVFLSLVSGCRSAVSTSSKALVVGKPKVEKEMSLPKSDNKLERAPTEESIRQSAMAALKIMKENAPKVKLNEHFNAIVNADNSTSANNAIIKALTMFASPKTPVVMEMSSQNGITNYEKPTTILAYFNYLKAQRKNLDDIKNLKIDTKGKIIEVELKKNNLIPIQ